MTESATGTPILTPAPKKSNVVDYILIAVLTILVGGLLFARCDKPVVVKKAAPVAVVQAPVKVAPIDVEYNKVATTPIVAEVTATPVVVAPVVTPVVKAPVVSPTVPVVTPTAPVHVAPHVCNPDAPNHGNFIHGNSNPCWPYSPGHSHGR
jgi:hypothetical protein